MMSDLYDSRTEHFVRIVPDGELAGGDAALRGVEENVEAGVPHDEGSILKRLAVADADAEASEFADRHTLVRTDPVDIGRGDAQAAARKALVPMAFSHIHYIFRNIGLDDEK